MKIGEIAERSGVSASIIRHYEHRGVLPPAVRNQYGHREYGDAELACIAFVTSARKLGCSFPEIQTMIEMQERHHVPSSKLLILLSRKLEDVDNEMERLRQIQSVLSRLHTHELNLLAVQKVSELAEG